MSDMDEVTPTTFVVRQVWKNMTRRPDVALGEFDRWLTTVRAEAWDEGFLHGLKAASRVNDDDTLADWEYPTENPYRG